MQNDETASNIARASRLIGFKYFQPILPMIEQLRQKYTHHNRKLYMDEYVLLLILFFFNPTVKTLRGLQKYTELEEVKTKLGINRCSLGSLSEAGNIFDVKLLEPLVGSLLKKALKKRNEGKLTGIGKQLVAADGTIIHAIPKAFWALWLDDEHRAAKLHLELDINNMVPTMASVTEGNGNEKEIFRQFIKAGKLYVLDNGYARYNLFEEIGKKGSDYVVRLRDNAVWKEISKNELTEADKKEGVQRDLVVWLGVDNPLSNPVRIIEIYHKDNSGRKRKSKVSSKTKSYRESGGNYTMLLVTNRFDLPAETIALIYRLRWQIELFFRWFKCVLGFDHLVSISKNGVALQIYCALIASLLISLWCYEKPTVRTYEMFVHYFMGIATEEELDKHISKLKKTC